MVSFKPLLACLAAAASQPIDHPAITLEARGYGWLENSLGTEAYRCEYWTNPFFDKIHLAGRNSTHSEHEIKGAAKEAGAVTGWHWKDLGEGSFDVKVGFDLSFAALLLLVVVQCGPTSRVVVLTRRVPSSTCLFWRITGWRTL